MIREPAGPPVPWEYAASFILFLIALCVVLGAFG